MLWRSVKFLMEKLKDLWIGKKVNLMQLIFKWVSNFQIIKIKIQNQPEDSKTKRHQQINKD